MVALMAGDLTEASRLAGEDLARFCSVPSLRAAARSLDEWMAESFTEIVMLNGPPWSPPWSPGPWCLSCDQISLRVLPTTQ